MHFVNVLMTTAKVSGNLVDPKVVYISDSQLDWICKKPQYFATTMGEQFVSIPGGKVEHALKFIQQEHVKLKSAEVIVVHIGTNNFCKLKGFGRQPLIAIIVKDTCERHSKQFT